MKLNPPDLGLFAVGLDRGEIVEGAWRAHRLPPAMRERHLNQDPDGRFRVRMACPSCVRLRFVANTRRLAIGLHYGLETRPRYQGALVVDDQEEIPFGPQSRCDSWGDVIFEQPDAQKRLFDLWLPHLSQADVVALEVDDGCSVAAARPLPVRWLAYGDSITQGVIATLPTRSVVARCARALNAEAHNVALGSAVLDAWLADTIPVRTYDIVSIAYGANDFVKDVPSQQFQQNARRLVSALARKQPDLPILLLTPLTWAGLRQPNKAGLSYDAYRQALLPLAEEFHQVRIVHGDRLLPDTEEWFEGQVHPNDAGFALYAENLLPHLKAALDGQSG